MVEAKDPSHPYRSDTTAAIAPDGTEAMMTRICWVIGDAWMRLDPVYTSNGVTMSERDSGIDAYKRISRTLMARNMSPTVIATIISNPLLK
jgi:hypothetical protein